MSKNLTFLLFITVTMLFSTSAMAAQSTVDVPVTKELMDKARQKVMAQKKSVVKGADEYVIGTGDVLSVQVYGEGDMSIEAPTAPRGGESGGSPRGRR